MNTQTGPVYGSLKDPHLFPELKYIDEDILEEWRKASGREPYCWDFKNIIATQTNRNIRMLTDAVKELKHDPDQTAHWRD